METTVRTIHEIPSFKENMVLIAGKEGLDNLITSVSVMEVPDFADGQLEPGLFVLTTFYNFQSNEEQMVETIRKLSANKASGIIIKIKRFIDTIPPRVIEEANQKSLPLFCTQNLLFGNIISLISSVIVNNAFNKIKTANEQYQEIFSALLNNEKIGTFSNKIGKRLNHSFACVSEKGEVQAKYFTEDFNRRAITQDYYEQLLEKLQNKTEKQPITSPMHLEDCSVFLCNVKSKILGYFIVWHSAELTEYEILISQQMSTFLSMKFMEEYVIQADLRKRVSAVLDEILYNRSNKLSVIKERLFLLGYKELKSFLLFFLPISEKKISKNTKGTDWFLNKVQLYFPGSVAGFIMGGFVIITPSSEEIPLPFNKDQKLLKKLDNFLGKMQLKCSVGCSTRQSDLRKIPECLEQAKQALSYGSLFKTAENIHCYENFSELNTISYMIGTAGEEMIYRTVINPIRDYDHEYKQDLWLTLEECLSHNTLEAAANALFIHSSTLRYRLQNIYNLTGYNFFDNMGKYVLNTAYILYKITN